MELVRQQDGAGAISYAREHLSRWAEPFEAEMQRAFAVLVFTADTQCSRYQVAASTLFPVVHFALQAALQCDCSQCARWQVPRRRAHGAAEAMHIRVPMAYPVWLLSSSALVLETWYAER